MSSVARALGERSRAKVSHKERVLLVEDSRMFTVALSDRISRETGAEVIVCSTLEEMRNLLDQPNFNFSAVVADLNLKDSPRAQVLDVLATTGLPTIVFTGNFELGRADIPADLNVVEFIIKNSPEIFEDVVSSVQQLLVNHDLRVLLVGGTEATRGTSADLLRARRFLVSEADTGEAGISLLNDLPDIGIIVVDEEIPDMTGNALIRTIRQNFDRVQLRIIGMAGGDESLSSASQFRRAGADDFIMQPFSDDEFHQRIAGNAETLAHFRKLQAVASRDFLTDMYNRRHLFQRGPILVQHCLDQGQPVSAAVMDIDHFKKFNDTYGHETGDLVLKAVARKIRELVGDTFHLSARLGGEEFAMLFRGMDVEEATVFCDSLREEVANTKIVAEEEELSVTISIGLAEIVEIETFDNYLHAADQYLYMAKSSGRNRVFSDYSIIQMFADRNAQKA